MHCDLGNNVDANTENCDSGKDYFLNSTQTIPSAHIVSFERRKLRDKHFYIYLERFLRLPDEDLKEVP